MDSRLHHNYLVPSVGFILVAGILYLCLSLPELPVAYVVASGATDCCSDCSCIRRSLCFECQNCFWVDECTLLSNKLNPEGIELIHAGHAVPGDSFVLNVVFDPVMNQRGLLYLRLPEGFYSKEDSKIVQLEAGQTKVVSFEVSVKEDVAEIDHTIHVDLLDPGWGLISSAEARVNV
jgi:hypothetical protein